MHISSDNIGCLSVETFQIGNKLDVSCFYITEKIKVSCFGMGRPIEVSCLELSENAVPQCYMIGQQIEVTLFKICSINKLPYLRVDPDYVWLTPDMLSGEFDIISNARWEIV